ncbi:MAG: hypothetical protein HRU09_05450 [Oligoflexales bacterium]|nr:hypothetical protein [Oligoflexales bacterium]
MARIVVSTVGPDNRVDVKINVSALDKVEAYHTKDTLSSRVSLTKDSGSIFLLPQETGWKREKRLTSSSTTPSKFSVEFLPLNSAHCPIFFPKAPTS